MAVLASVSNRTLQRAINAFPRWPLYVFGSAPGLWVFWLALNDRLGADPVKTLEHTLGLWALRFIIATLTVTPIRRFGGPNLVRFRRALGLLAFFYACAHLSAYLIFDQGLDARAIFADILKRPYITIGMAAFVLLIPLAVTSADKLRRKLGPRRWKRLHQLIYLIAPMGVVHYYLLVKADHRPPLIYGAIVLALLAYRAANWTLDQKMAAARKAAKTAKAREAHA